MKNEIVSALCSICFTFRLIVLDICLIVLLQHSAGQRFRPNSYLVGPYNCDVIQV